MEKQVVFSMENVFLKCHLLYCLHQGTAALSPCWNLSLPHSKFQPSPSPAAGKHSFVLPDYWGHSLGGNLHGPLHRAGAPALLHTFINEQQQRCHLISQRGE